MQKGAERRSTTPVQDKSADLWLKIVGLLIGAMLAMVGWFGSRIDSNISDIQKAVSSIVAVMGINTNRLDEHEKRITKTEENYIDINGRTYTLEGKHGN